MKNEREVIRLLKSLFCLDKPHGSRPSTSSSYHTSPKDKTGAIKSSGEGTEQKPEDKEKIDTETKEGEEKNIEKDGDGKNDKSASGSHSHEKSGPRKVVPFDIIKVGAIWVYR